MRRRYQYDKASGQVLEVYPEEALDVDAPAVHGDEMPPTWHPCDGNYYESRRKFRAVTAAHGCVELGNDKPTRRKWEPKTRPADHIREAREQLNFGYDRKRYEEFRREGIRRAEEADNMRRWGK